MIGSSGFLALCVLAATPVSATSSDNSFERSVVHAMLQESTPLPEGGIAEEPKAPTPPPPLPDDPGYEDKTLPPTPEGEGIPGLPPLDEQSPPPPAKVEPRKEKAPNSPPRAEPRVDKPGEALCTDEPGMCWASDACCDPADDSICPRRRWLQDVCWDGWIDQGATVNTLSPRDRSNGTVTFNDRSNDYQLNQLYMRLMRNVDEQSDVWQVGGRVDLLYGTDSLYTTARGLEVTDDFGSKWNAQRYGLAMPQAYMEAYSPWGKGLSMKIGHFYSPMGYENVMAPCNFFYSHSYSFQYAEPFTYTGLLGSTNLGNFTLRAGMTRGWNNWESNNNDLGFVGGGCWSSDSRRTNVAFYVNSSREQPDPSANVRTNYSLVLQQMLFDRWQYVLQHDLGDEPGGGVRGGTGAWCSVNQYLFYTISDAWKAGMRFEWFRDVNGARVPGANQTADYFELTAGVNWTPNKRLMIRPSVRWDWTGTSGYYPFGDGTRSSQVLLDCDVVARF